MELKEIIGRQVAKRRKELDFSQEQLSKLIHLTKSQVSKLERCLSLPGAETLYQLSIALKTNIDYFFNQLNYNNTTEETLLIIYRQLDESQQQELIKYASYLIEKNINSNKE